MISQDHIDQYNEEGYTIVENVFSKEDGVRISFSKSTKIVSAITNVIFITPAANKIAIKNQQQNTQ